MTQLERMKILIGITDTAQDALLTELLAQAEEWMLNYIQRTELPAALAGLQVRIAVTMYNRRGIEGMSAASEGGLSRTIDALPEDMRRAMNMYRAVRTIPLTKRTVAGGA